MRTKSAQAAAILRNPSHTARVVVWVADSGGTLREIGATAGDFDPIVQVDVEESVDNARTLKFTLLRQQGFRSRSPFVVNGSNPLQPSAASIQLGREVKIECITMPPDSSLELSGTRIEIFRGFVDQIEWPEDVMTVTCADQQAKLRDTWIEQERVYALCTGANATRGAYVWDCDHPGNVIPYAVNDLVLPSKLKANGHFYKVTTATSVQSAAEPTWPTGSGATVVSGGVTFTEAGATATTGTAVETVMQQIITDNGLAFTLQVPVSPGWTIYPYVQQRSSVQDALNVFRDQIGWRLSFTWNSGGSAYLLTLYAPDRTRVTVDKVIGADEEVECTNLAVDVWSIRNVVRVIYGDTSSRDPGGTPTRITREVSDSASITKYGRRFMEICEADTANIDTAAEADTLANACLADLKDPTAEFGLRLPVDPYMEIGDMVQVPPDGRRFDATQLLATFTLSHTFSANGARTTISLQGKPASMRDGWLQKDGKVKASDVHLRTVLDSTGVAISASSVVGGQSLLVGEGSATGGKKYAGQHFEVHVSTSPGFTPGPTTKATTGDTGGTLANLVPGKVYYTKTVPFLFNGQQKVRGSPGPETSFIGGRAKAGHYDSTCTQSHLPLNGNFEHALDDLNSAPFDHWNVVTRPSETTEGWGLFNSVYWGNDASKGNFVKLQAMPTQRGNLVSDAFEVRRGLRAMNLYASIRRQGSSAVSGKDLIVDLIGYSDAALTSVIVNNSVFLSGSAAGPYPSLNTWYDVGFSITAALGAFGTAVNFLTIGIRRGTAGDNTFSWEVGDVYTQEADFIAATFDSATIAQPAWTAATLVNSFTNFGGGYQDVKFLKDSLGFIHLRGLAARATAALSTTIFTLPAGLRPAANMNFTIACAGKSAQLEILSTGVVDVWAADSATWFTDISLEGITFDTR